MLKAYPRLFSRAGGSPISPHYRIQGGRLYQDSGHPDGSSCFACCEQRGDKFYASLGGPFSDPWAPVFVLEGSTFRTGEGHPDGAYRHYYELREEGLPEPKPAISKAKNSAEPTQKTGVKVAQPSAPPSTTSAYRPPPPPPPTDLLVCRKCHSYARKGSTCPKCGKPMIEGPSVCTPDDLFPPQRSGRTRETLLQTLWRFLAS